MQRVQYGIAHLFMCDNLYKKALPFEGLINIQEKLYQQFYTDNITEISDVTKPLTKGSRRYVTMYLKNGNPTY